jgi:bifunctional DNA-binding transcriptional regulator/antitoxin component of YhaV-PrlF toxin-antitoxin module
MEKKIKVSTQGRITIPQILRKSMKIMDGQPVMIRSEPAKREIIIELLPTITDYEKN